MPSQSIANKVLIGFNPHAGARDPRKRRMVEQLCAALAEHGLTADVVSDRETLAAQAAQELNRGTLRAVVAAGGDGTASDLVNRIDRRVPIALLPLGTENLLARHLGIAADSAIVARMISIGNTMSLDAGRANGRLFLLMVGCGFDAEVVRRLHTNRNGHISQWSYAKPILAAIRNYQYPAFRVTCRLGSDEMQAPLEHAFDARFAFVSNLPCYAGRLCFSPHAAGDDGQLDVCAFQGGSLWTGLRYLFGVLARRHEGMHDCVTAKATQVVIESSEPVPFQLDGDPGGMLPLTIDLLPRRMTVIVPPEGASARCRTASTEGSQLGQNERC